MPLRVLHICVTPCRLKRVTQVVKGLRDVDVWLQLKRSTAKGPKNGEGEIHGVHRRRINELEADIHQALLNLKDLGPLDVEQGIVITVCRSGHKARKTRSDYRKNPNANPYLP